MAELDAVKVTRYSNNVYTMAQQQGSKLSNLCTRVEMSGERTTIERVGETEAVQLASKYDDSPIVHTPFGRRSLFGHYYHWGDMVDWKDNEEILLDPTGPVTRAGAAALGRALDKVIIEQGIFGDAYEGKDGNTPVAFPSSQKVAITAGGNGGAKVGLNIEKLIQAKSLIGNADIDLDDPNELLYFVYTQSELDDLLRTTQVTSADYNAVQALYKGTISFFMGFHFVRISKKIIPTVDAGDSDSAHACFAFAKSCVAFGNPIPIKGKIAERPDKQFNWYSYMKMMCGATRFEDGGVVHVPCLI